MKCEKHNKEMDYVAVLDIADSDEWVCDACDRGDPEVVAEVPKYCIDCKCCHCEIPGVTYAGCSADQLGVGFDVVSGKRHTTNCYDIRGDDLLCGPKAQWFEAR